MVIFFMLGIIQNSYFAPPPPENGKEYFSTVYFEYLVKLLEIKLMKV